jgi:hypothetical protein
MKVGGGLTTVEVQTEGREAVRGWVYLRSLNNRLYELWLIPANTHSYKLNHGLIC